MTKLEQQQQKIPFTQLYRLATKSDKVMIYIGSLCAFINGVIQPLFGIFFGDVAQSMSPLNSPQYIFDECVILAFKFLIAGSISFVLSCGMLYCWIIVGERQAIQIRLAYYRSLITQDIGYFDTINSNEISSQVASDCFKIQQAIGEKICLFMYTISMLIGSIATSFYQGWQIALVCSITIPLIFYSCKFMTWVANGVVRKTAQVYQEAGGYAEQALSSIRTVKSLNGIEFESNQYTSLVEKAFKISLKFSIFTGVAIGIQTMMYFFDYSLTFWVGSLFIENELYNDNMKRSYQISEVIAVFISLMITSFRLGGATDSIKYFEEAQFSGYKIFKIIDQQPSVHQNENGFNIQDKVKQGEITFKDVKFSYPNRKDVTIYDNLNFTIQPKKRTAFVGKSGCGKSTIIQLLERFYDPISGSVLLDGVDLKDFKLSSLRQSIGYVSQEPVLFGTTIRENLRYAKLDATEEEMIEALKKANIWSFVEKSENKLDTFVGNNGSQLSGGQRQRICIARAILKNPVILLLDEATSALDNKSEAIVQKTLDQVAKDITTIIIAHRLTTIQNADEIIVFDQGKILERGNHEELLLKKGAYYEFVQKQSESKSNEKKQYKLRSNQQLDTMSNLEIETQNVTKVNLSTNHLNILTTNANMQENTHQFLPTLANDEKLEAIQLEIPQIIRKKSSKKESNGHINQLLQEQKEQTRGVFKVIKYLLNYNKEERWNAFFGILFACLNGVAYPLSGWAMANIGTLLLDPNVENFRELSNQYSLTFALIGVGSLICYSFQYYFQSKVADKLTFTLRRDLFKKYLLMPMSWFDKPQNNSGALSQRLSSDCSSINTLVSSSLTFNINNISTLITSICLGLSADWRTTLVALVLMPLVIISGILYAIRMNAFSSKMNKSSEDTSMIINESTGNIRTVASLGNYDCFAQNFYLKLNSNLSEIKKSAYQAGKAIGLVNFTLFGVYGLMFLSGSAFHKYYDVKINDVLISILSLMVGSFGIGKNAEYMGDVGTAVVSANKVMDIIQSKDEIQNNYGKQCPETIQGEITFENVSFKYPERDGKVLSNVSFKIPAQSQVAFVGPSGSGKSSIIQLIQGFYTTYSGKILLDGVDIREYNLKKYRNYYGSVQQEPVLFNGSIKENIIYNQENVQENDMIAAADKANALQFIQEFKGVNQEGFSKQVGVKGSQLSGGQKQRIAISRVLLKNPQIMLLDEATSALDSQNERIIQESLNKILEGKTSISVAHRLSTIKESDIIFVLNNGEIVEQGDYESLMNMKNHFYNLQQQQQQINSSEQK